MGGPKPGGKGGLGSSLWALWGGLIWAVGSICGFEWISEGLSTCGGEIASWVLVVPSCVPSSWVVAWYGSFLLVQRS